MKIHVPSGGETVGGADGDAAGSPVGIPAGRAESSRAGSPAGGAEGDPELGAPGRRRSKEKVREIMLATALAMAVEAGVGVSLESISVEEVIQSARVPRSSVYRIWPAKEMFVDDLLCHMASRQAYFSGQDVFDPATFEVVTRTIKQNSHLLGSAPGRRAVLCEGVRLAVQRNVRALRENRSARIHTALIATVSETGSSGVRPRMARALDDAEAASRRSIVALFRHLVMPTLGLRLRDPGATLEHMALAGSALAQGLALRHVLADAVGEQQADLKPADGADRGADGSADGAGWNSARLLDQPVPGPGLDGRPAEWSLAALSYLGLIDAFLEPDPGFDALTA